MNYQDINAKVIDFRVLMKNGILLCGLDNGINFIFDDTETAV